MIELKRRVVDGYHVEIDVPQRLHWPIYTGTRAEWEVACMKHDAEDMAKYVETLKDVDARAVMDFHVECSYCGEEWKKENMVYNRKRHESVPCCCEKALLEHYDASFQPNFEVKLQWLLAVQLPVPVPLK